jgi:hypothetical protein
MDIVRSQVTMRDRIISLLGGLLVLALAWLVFGPATS